MTARRRPPAPAALPAGVEVHDFAREQRDQRRRHPIHSHLVVVQTYRYVCTCGWSTKWNDNPLKARAACDRHNVPGQLSMVIPGVDARA